MMLLLPENMRDEVRKPFGKVLTGAKLLAELKGAIKPIIAVGDQCAQDMIASGTVPDVMIFDFKIKRVEISKEMKETLAPHAKSAIVVLSPPAVVTDELEAAVKKVLEEGKGAVFVAGEDDLSSLLVMKHAKKGTLVYGQPGEGAVVVPLGGREIREKVAGIMERMPKA